MSVGKIRSGICRCRKRLARRSTIHIGHAQARHQFIAQATVDDHQEDWTRTAQWTSSNPAVARVDQTGLVTPVADGEVTITATAQSGGSYTLLGMTTPGSVSSTRRHPCPANEASSTPFGVNLAT